MHPVSTYFPKFWQRIQVERPESWKVITFRPHKYYRYHPANPSVAGTKLLNLTTFNTQKESISQAEQTMLRYTILTFYCNSNVQGENVVKWTQKLKKGHPDFIITLEPIKSLLLNHIPTEMLQCFRPKKQFVLPAYRALIFMNLH